DPVQGDVMDTHPGVDALRPGDDDRRRGENARDPSPPVGRPEPRMYDLVSALFEDPPEMEDRFHPHFAGPAHMMDGDPRLEERRFEVSARVEDGHLGSDPLEMQVRREPDELHLGSAHVELRNHEKHARRPRGGLRRRRASAGMGPALKVPADPGLDYLLMRLVSSQRSSPERM